MKETSEEPEKKILTQNRILLSKIKRTFLFRNVWLARLILFLGVIGVVVVLLILIVKLVFYLGWDRYINLGRNFLFPRRDSFSGSYVNVLVLGKAGFGHEAPDLTDTMLLVSFNLKEGQENISLLSLPRDIWIEDLRAKLNSVYYWGNQKKEGGGLVLTKKVVEEIVGVPIQYGVVVDFAGFSKLIDSLGGIEVEVENSFTDERFPIPGKEDDLCGGDLKYNCRFETVSFTKGLQMMDGAEALKFVRSRHAEDLTEGTDLARSKRQQQVILGIKNRLLDREVMFSWEKIQKVNEIVWSMIETDMNEEMMAVLAGWAYRTKQYETLSIPDEFLINPPLVGKYDYLYVFVPRRENWEEIHSWLVGKINGINSLPN